MLDSGLPDHIDDKEPLLRFLTSDSQFNSAMPKPSAFMPGPTDMKTSVFRQDATALDELWATADREIAAGRRAKAAAVLAAADIRQALLDVESHEPPPRHANIIGWPIGGDPDLAKAQCKEFALLLCQAAALVRR